MAITVQPRRMQCRSLRGSSLPRAFPPSGRDWKRPRMTRGDRRWRWCSTEKAMKDLAQAALALAASVCVWARSYRRLTARRSGTGRSAQRSCSQMGGWPCQL